ncbi:MAG: SMR family transporter [Candidatus Omnitrophota bacterium]
MSHNLSKLEEFRDDLVRIFKFRRGIANALITWSVICVILGLCVIIAVTIKDIRQGSSYALFTGIGIAAMVVMGLIWLPIAVALVSIGLIAANSKDPSCKDPKNKL